LTLGTKDNVKINKNIIIMVSLLSIIKSDTIKSGTIKISFSKLLSKRAMGSSPMVGSTSSKITKEQALGSN
jgi:hypothetical protein